MIHIEPIVGAKVALRVRVYSGVPDDVPARDFRLDYDATCDVVWHPQGQYAFIEALHGRVTKKDTLDLWEKLFTDYGVISVGYERADETKVNRKRIGIRKWVKMYSHDFH